MALTNAQAHSIFRCLRTLYSMFQDRHYHKIQGPKFDSAMQLRQFCLDTDILHLSPMAVDQDKCRVLAVFFQSDKVGIREVRRMISVAQGLLGASLHLILMYRGSLSHFARREIKNKNCTIEVFQERNFFDPTSHVWSTPHHKLDPQAKLIIEEKAGGLDRLPKILASDKLVLYYHWKVGDIIQISQPLPEGQVEESYRVVVES